jgi:hypothetical protein
MGAIHLLLPKVLDKASVKHSGHRRIQAALLFVELVHLSGSNTHSMPIEAVLSQFDKFII